MKFTSQISFLYYRELTEAAHFFENILKLEAVVDQGFAKIYRISNGGFIGIVDESRGYCNSPKDKNVLITLVTEDVREWYEHLSAAGVNIDAPPKIHEGANVECFFFEGPGGYAFEIQRFLDPIVEQKFL